MKLTRINPFKYALIGIAGMALATSIHAAVVWSHDFEGAAADVTAGTGGSANNYAYGSLDGWTQSSTTADPYWYNTNYATVTSAKRPDPFGTVAFHGAGSSGAYTYRDTGLTFVSGQEYRFSFMLSEDNGSTVDNQRFRFYIEDSATQPSDSNSLTYVDFRPDGTGGSKNASATSIVRVNYESVSDAGNWQLNSFNYTATAGDDGKPISIGMWMEGNDIALDNIAIETVPEPSSAALLGLGGFALILRRRK